MSNKVRIRAVVAPVNGSVNAMGITFVLALPRTAELFLSERGYVPNQAGFTKVVICHRENLDGIFCAEDRGDPLAIVAANNRTHPIFIGYSFPSDSSWYPDLRQKEACIPTHDCTASGKIAMRRCVAP